MNDIIRNPAVLVVVRINAKRLRKLSDAGLRIQYRTPERQVELNARRDPLLDIHTDAAGNEVFHNGTPLFGRDGERTKNFKLTKLFGDLYNANKFLTGVNLVQKTGDDGGLLFIRYEDIVEGVNIYQPTDAIHEQIKEILENVYTVMYGSTNPDGVISINPSKAVSKGEERKMEIHALRMDENLNFSFEKIADPCPKDVTVKFRVFTWKVGEDAPVKKITDAIHELSNGDTAKDYQMNTHAPFWCVVVMEPNGSRKFANMVFAQIDQYNDGKVHEFRYIESLIVRSANTDPLDRRGGIHIAEEAL